MADVKRDSGNIKICPVCWKSSDGLCDGCYWQTKQRQQERPERKATAETFDLSDLQKRNRVFNESLCVPNGKYLAQVSGWERYYGRDDCWNVYLDLVEFDVNRPCTGIIVEYSSKKFRSFVLALGVPFTPNLRLEDLYGKKCRVQVEHGYTSRQPVPYWYYRVCKFEGWPDGTRLNP